MERRSRYRNRPTSGPNTPPWKLTLCFKGKVAATRLALGEFTSVKGRPHGASPGKTWNSLGFPANSGLKKEAEDMGFEPTTGFPAPDFESGSSDQIPSENGDAVNSDRYLIRSEVSDELSGIIEKWSTLSATTQQTIVKLIELDTFQAEAANVHKPSRPAKTTRKPAINPTPRRGPLVLAVNPWRFPADLQTVGE